MITLQSETEAIHVTYYVISKGQLLNFCFWDGASTIADLCQTTELVQNFILIHDLFFHQGFTLLGFTGQKCSHKVFLQQPGDVCIYDKIHLGKLN